jgi:hypothetical protein
MMMHTQVALRIVMLMAQAPCPPNQTGPIIHVVKMCIPLCL